jgi:hypothetical protein
MAGIPRPRLTPRITFFDTLTLPPAIDICELGTGPETVVFVGNGGGTQEVGLPDITGKFFAPAPKATKLGTDVCVNFGSNDVEPGDTVVTKIMVEVDISVVWSEPGQLIRFEDRQLIPVKI